MLLQHRHQPSSRVLWVRSPPAFVSGADSDIVQCRTRIGGCKTTSLTACITVVGDLRLDQLELQNYGACLLTAMAPMHTPSQQVGGTSVLEIELQRLRNSVIHLQDSNQQLKQLITDEQAAGRRADPEYKLALEENIVTIAKQKARIEALEIELGKSREGEQKQAESHLQHQDGQAHSISVPPDYQEATAPPDHSSTGQAMMDVETLEPSNASAQPGQGSHSNGQQESDGVWL